MRSFVPTVLSNTVSLDRRVERLLSSCENWWDMRTWKPGDQFLANLGTVGSATDLRFGSTSGTYIRTVNGETYASFPGTAANWLTVPSATNLNITGDFEIVARVLPIANGVGREFVGKGLMYRFFMQPNDVLGCGITRGGIQTYRFSTVAIANGSKLWVKVTRSSSSGAINFYTAPDSETEPTSWTQLGTTVAGITGALDTSSDLLGVGHYASNGNAPFLGNIYRAIVRDGIGGSAVFDFTPSGDNSSTTMLAATGQTVTRYTTGTDSADPTGLAFAGETYVNLPGTNGNNLAVAQSFGALATGDLTLIGDVSLLATGILPTICAVRGLSTAFQFRFGNGDRTLQFLWTEAQTFLTFTSGVSVPVSAVQVAATRRFVSPNVEVRFFYREFRYGPWTQLGGIGLSLSAGVGDGDGANMIIGDFSPSGAQPFNGNIRRVTLAAGAAPDGTPGGTTFFDFTPSGPASATTMPAATGQTVTVNRSATGHKTSIVTAPMARTGVDDYWESPANSSFDPALGSFTVLWFGRMWETPPTNGAFFGHRAGGGVSGTWVMYTSAATRSVTAQVADGVAISQVGPAGTYIAGEPMMLGLEIDRSNQTVRMLLGTSKGVSYGTTNAIVSLGSIAAPASVLRVCSDAVSGLYNDTEMRAGVIHRKLFTPNQIADINAYYQKMMA